jgi:putative redox protein
MVAAHIGRNAYRTELIATGHELIADEPLDAGGTDMGPSPGQFLQISLAACTVITLRMYANRKNIPLENARVEVKMERQTDRTLFQRHIYLEGPLSDEEKQKLLDIANACPIHRTLTSPITIETVIINS